MENEFFLNKSLNGIHQWLDEKIIIETFTNLV